MPAKGLARTVSGLVLAVAAFFVLEAVLPSTTPGGILVLGLTLGALNSLLAVGIVLVYRSTRIINFTQGQLGICSGVLTVELVESHWNYFLAAGSGLLSAAVVGGLCEMLVIRRFKTSPRLVATVSTIALSEVLAAVGLLLPVLFHHTYLDTNFKTPLSRLRIEIFPVTFDGNYVAVLVVTLVAIVGIGGMLRYSRYGAGVRAAAERSERAALCGVPIKSLSTGVWVVAGLLSGATAILQAPVVGLSAGALAGPGILVQGLAAATIAGFDSLTVTVLAAIGLGVLTQAFYWSYGTGNASDLVILAIILVAFTARRKRPKRSDSTDDSEWLSVGSMHPTPRALLALPSIRSARIALVVALAGVAVGLPAGLSESKQLLASTMLIYAIVAMSLVVLTGWAGQISLGQMAIVGIGGAVAGKLFTSVHADFFASLGAGAAAGMLIAFGLGLPALRLRGLFLAVTTLAFGVATSDYIFGFSWLTPSGAVSRPFLFGRIDLNPDLSFYYVVLTITLGVAASLYSLRRSRLGRAVNAVRDNELAAQSYGISPVAAKLIAFCVSGAVAGLAGGLLVFNQFHFLASDFSPDASILVLAIAVIGGVGTLGGAVTGAIVILGTQFLLSGTAALLSTGLGLLVILLVLPSGLVSSLYSVRDWGLVRIGNCHGIETALTPLARSPEDSASADENETAAIDQAPHSTLAGGPLVAGRRR